MSRFWKFLSAILVVGLVATVGVGIVSAQDDPPEPPLDGRGRGRGARGMGFDREGGMGLFAIDSDAIHAELAGLLNIDIDVFEAAIESGETIFTLAQEYGVDVEVLQAVMAEAHAEALAQAVADGVITQEQADWMLERQTMRYEGFSGEIGELGEKEFGGFGQGRWDGTRMPRTGQFDGFRPDFMGGDGSCQ
jgi:hypothetical protein